MTQKNVPPAKEAFVPQADRPEVKPDTPVGQLTVRDLTQILGQTALKPPVLEKLHAQFEKIHWKFEKFEKFEKHEKHEKFEKFEWEVINKQVVELPPDPTKIGGDPVTPVALNQVIQAISGLANQVTLLQNQVAELQKKGGG